jgi:hypothetical protein
MNRFTGTPEHVSLKHYERRMPEIWVAGIDVSRPSHRTILLALGFLRNGNVDTSLVRRWLDEQV